MTLTFDLQGHTTIKLTDPQNRVVGNIRILKCSNWDLWNFEMTPTYPLGVVQKKCLCTSWEPTRITCKAHCNSVGMRGTFMCFLMFGLNFGYDLDLWLSKSVPIFITRYHNLQLGIDLLHVVQLCFPSTASPNHFEHSLLIPPATLCISCTTCLLDWAINSRFTGIPYELYCQYYVTDSLICRVGMTFPCPMGCVAGMGYVPGLS